jgi:hypothetical protein
MQVSEDDDLQLSLGGRLKLIYTGKVLVYKENVFSMAPWQRPRGTDVC